MASAREIWCTLLIAFCSSAATVIATSELFMDWEGQRLLSISSERCQVFVDSNEISYMTQRNSIQHIGQQEMGYMIKACSMMDRPIQNRPALFVYPGTKWCGSGSTASSFSELGSLFNEDRCCREHDFCPASLRSGQCRNGLCNTSPFTRSHCECDVQFRRCLQSVGSAASHALGALYFNIARVPCFSAVRQPTRVARLGFDTGCDNPYSQCLGPPRRETQPTYRYHSLAPYSFPGFGSPFSQVSAHPYSAGPNRISNVLFGVFRLFGVV
ncbi:phospholipase A2 phaiodactylipin-like [Neocloeon triangulifer]|uniref:phospholipase A2 phaiodactylipin-like n=1 Tax=Neocloeon triangulifer TaxID=2078957 RepID=UPI00286F35BB|nr:phospholipase A2 phaiodactylipin-like [Neocloeon triangulifer]